MNLDNLSDYPLQSIISLSQVDDCIRHKGVESIMAK
jgi:hypothetical protein